MYKVVLWDFGGVITSSPFDAFNRFEAEQGLPKDIIRTINSNNPDTNAWALLESNKIDKNTFDEQFAREAAELGHKIGGLQVLALLAGDVRPEMVKALKLIKAKFRIGCITNNIKSAGQGAGMADTSERRTKTEEVLALFDSVIESSKAGMRKPDPRIYQIACEKFNIRAEEAIFLDDLGINLKPARAMGMATIKVTNAQQALIELETLLAIKLR
ncbi:MAG: HAD-IA family hydrolase [Pseudomonadales bacterium]|nr:HAD-IA family hydrolase [Pseudomonadales bacterium]